MYFEKFFTNGEVTRNKFAQFHCDMCGQKHCIEVRRTDFDTSPRPCPVCKAIDSNDLHNHLIQKRDNLVKQIQELQVQLDQLNVELVMTENIKEKEPCPVKS